MTHYGSMMIDVYLTKHQSFLGVTVKPRNSYMVYVWRMAHLHLDPGCVTMARLWTLRWYIWSESRPRSYSQTFNMYHDCSWLILADIDVYCSDPAVNFDELWISIDIHNAGAEAFTVTLATVTAAPRDNAAERPGMARMTSTATIPMSIAVKSG